MKRRELISRGVMLGAAAAAGDLIQPEPAEAAGPKFFLGTLDGGTAQPWSLSATLTGSAFRCSAVDELGDANGNALVNVNMIGKSKRNKINGQVFNASGLDFVNPIGTFVADISANGISGMFTIGGNTRAFTGQLQRMLSTRQLKPTNGKSKFHLEREGSPNILNADLNVGNGTAKYSNVTTDVEGGSVTPRLRGTARFGFTVDGIGIGYVDQLEKQFPNPTAADAGIAAGECRICSTTEKQAALIVTTTKGEVFVTQDFVSAQKLQAQGAMIEHIFIER